jgi:hypothetical protein
MLLRSKPLLTPVLLIAVAMIIVLLGNACRDRARPGEVESERELRGEPNQYSATIVRTIDDGVSHETTITREVRSGEQRREEWTEQGQNRALIWRPDLGKSYLLDLDRQAFIEIALAGENSHDGSHSLDRASADSTNGLVQAVDRALDDAPSPDRVETRMLPIAEIGGHSCKVYEQRAIFPDGHIEITRTFRARDLGGLALRTESESQPASVRIITERKDVSLDVRLDVAPDAFTVPANFKKVDKLER